MASINRSDPDNYHFEPGLTDEERDDPFGSFFNSELLLAVVMYSVMFAIAAVGNLAVFVTIVRYKNKTRFDWLILHLTLADMIVTFLSMPVQIGWHDTVTWKAGNAGCKILMFLDQIGFNLSASIRAVICIDRYHTISRSLSFYNIAFRTRIMVLFAWILSVIASIPAGVIFHIEEYSFLSYNNLKACVSSGFFPTRAHELAYNIFEVSVLYVAPLLVMIVTLLLICYEMCGRSQPASPAELNRRRTSEHCLVDCENEEAAERLSKDMQRTLKMTAVLALLFIMCWTPYFIMTVWHMLNCGILSEMIMTLSHHLFRLAVLNSCINPLIFGVFSHRGQVYCSAIYRRLTFRTTQQSTADQSPQDQSIQDQSTHDQSTQDQIIQDQCTQSQDISIPDLKTSDLGTSDLGTSDQRTPNADLALSYVGSSTEATTDDREYLIFPNVSNMCE